MLQSTYNFYLVGTSLLIAALASYTTLDLAARISIIEKKLHRSCWLFGGACAMGLGIWSMHFVGMLAFSLPIPLGYDLAITCISLLIAIVVSYFALDIATRGNLSLAKLSISGTLLGLGIAAMHYTGMFAMRMSPSIQYDVPLLALSIGIAIAAATAALWIASTLRFGHLKLVRLRRVGAAIMMGLAITGMHYTGMAAADFPLGSICTAASGLSVNWLAVTVAVATVNVLSVTLVLSILDSRLERRTNLFANSLKSANESLQHQATHDALTGLPNRYLLSERIQHAINVAERNQSRFALYFIDLDGFKAVNDSLGHTVGDRLLKEIADRLRATIRKEDIVARLGGDEFVVLIEKIPDATTAAHIAEKLFDCFKSEFALLDSGMSISSSIGISLYPDNGETIDTLLSHADAAMYEVKAGGRNNYRFFEAAMNVANLRTIEIQQGLRNAIRNNQFFLQYQPKWGCDDGTILGAEALLRWHHPDLGMISPAEFIPVAEQCGQIIAIDRWVVEEVCRQLREWSEAGIPTTKIAVNLSQINFRSASLVDDLTAVAGKYGIDPSKLMFEITESVAMQNAEETMRTIEKLQKVGFDLAIDDFGTGYSSLSYLQQFSVRQLKVDRMFVNSLSKTDSKGTSVVAAIVTLAHSLNMRVVAEGVETQAQLAILKEIECDEMQGYLMAKPLPKDEFVKLLTRTASLSEPV
jgi:diguanylate cyclase (GGDEF)-like protein